jgi:hypothetical protein
MHRKKNLFWTTIIFHQSILWPITSGTSKHIFDSEFFLKRKFGDRFKLLDAVLNETYDLQGVNCG